MTKDLQKKVDMALRLIDAAGTMAAKHGQPLEIAYSGGKDSDVILELARMVGGCYRPIYKNTTIDPPGTIAHVRANGVEVLQPKQNFQDLIEQNGYPNRWRRFCCRELKEYKVLDYAVLGIRSEESIVRQNRYKEPEQCRIYSKTERVRQYLPILSWTADNVAEFVREREIICHSLYYDTQGNFHAERRLGCLCCPLMSRPKRIAEFKEYPAMLRYYIHAGQKYLNTHQNGKIWKNFGGNVYDWLTSEIFCDRERQFHQKFGATMFDDGIDTKLFLEHTFNVKL